MSGARCVIIIDASNKYPLEGALARRVRALCQNPQIVKALEASSTQAELDEMSAILCAEMSPAVADALLNDIVDHVT